MGTAIKVLMICVVAAILVGAGTAYYYTKPYNNGADTLFLGPIVKTDLPVVVVSDILDQDTMVSYLEECTENVIVQNKMPVAADGMILIIDSEWSGVKDLKLNTLLLTGTTILCIGSSEVFEGDKTGLGRSAFIEGASVYGIHYNVQTIHKKQTRDTVHCYSAVADDLKSAIERSYAWADTAGQLSFMPMTTFPELYELEIMFVYFDVRCGDYGWMRGMTTYTHSQWEESPGRPNFYITHFRQQAIPEIGKSTAAMYVKSSFTDDELELLSVAPTTKYGDNAVDILVSIFPFCEWYYKGDGITTSINYMYWESQEFIPWHDIDISRKYDRPITIEPGKTSKTYGVNGYSGIDIYGIKFCEQKSRINVTYETFEAKCVVNWAYE